MNKYLLISFFFVLTLQNNAQTITDIDDNIYNIVTIGSQIWMKENLKTTRYNDGTFIPEITDSTSWVNIAAPAYCWYNNATEYKATYGALYNWYTIDNGELCPTGWHIPTYNEFNILINYLGGELIAGYALKEEGTSHWISPNTGSTNSSGFTALPGGIRNGLGEFLNLGVYCRFWTSSENNSASAWQLGIGINDGLATLHDLPKNPGFSVRCIKNSSETSIDLEYSNSLMIFPNPVKDKIYLKNDKLSNYQVMIYDIQGNQIVNRSIGFNYIDISNLSKGTYIVKIIYIGNVVIKKLIKE